MIRRVSVSGWSTTFRRFEDGPIRIGPIAINVKDWSRPQTGESRLFANRVLEGMAVAGPFWPLVFYVPLGIAAIAYASNAGVSPLAITTQYGAGLLVWSLVEYAAHRFVFHHAPETRAGVAIQYLIHGVHHAYPDDSRRWMLPFGVTVPIAAVLTAVAWLLGAPAMAGLAGFVHGYLVYDLVHYTVHARPGRSRALRWLRAYHMRHHYAAPERQFGVSSALWDVVFKTK